MKNITCRDCGLVLRLSDDGAGFKCVYDLIEWKNLCKRRHLGDAAWCLVQRDGWAEFESIDDGSSRAEAISSADRP